ncbi:MAG: helix-turn-helix domain-containing protein [Planctomycetaceae bacterium]|nr:helix-turn-helix domain-containing protein [Planctomycetaceae bacterium]
MTGRLYTTYQVAELLGSAPEAVVEWMKKGILPFQRMNDKSIRISEKHLVEFLRRQGIDIGALMTQTAAREKEASRQSHEPSAPPAPAASRPGHFSDPGIPDAAETVPAELPAAQVLDAILRKALVSRATELVLQPSGGSLSLQLRIDGVMHAKDSFAQRLPAALVAELPRYLLEQAHLDAGAAAVRKAPFVRALDGQQVALELTAVPAAVGCTLICRLPAPSSVAAGLADLLAAEELATLRRLSHSGGGLILIAAAPRGGRDTLLQAMAGDVPLEGALAFALGGAINGYIPCPAGAMAADLGDADVAVVAELTDAATAKSAFDLARGGALVLAGITADSAAAATDILTETVGAGWATASTLKAVVAVRSARRLCPHCRRRVVLEAAELPAALSTLGGGTTYEPVGCAQCAHTGYSGRVLLTDVTEIAGPAAAALRQGTSPISQEHPPFMQSAVRCAAAGETSIAELARVLGFLR